MLNEKAQLQQVKDLINQQKYNEARSILQALPNNPTAQKWLQQLNERYPKADPTEDAKLAQARRFIDAERYDEAMAILAALPNNEVARKWLERIRTLDRTNSARGETPMSENFTPNPGSKPHEAGSPMDHTVPMLPPVVDLVRGTLFNALGKLGGVMVISALMFGVYYGIFFAIETDSTIVRTLISTALMAVAFYGLVFALSLAFSRLPRNLLLAAVAWAALITLVTGLIDSTSPLLNWIMIVLFGVGIAFLFSKYNSLIATSGESRLTRNQFILFALLLVALGFMPILTLGGSITAGFGILSSFPADVVSLFTALDFSAFLSGLLGGLIFGAVVGAAFTLTLEEAGN